MDVSRLGIKSELQLQAYATVTAIAMQNLSHICYLHCSLQQCQSLNPLNKARDWTSILMDTSQILNPLNHSGNSWTFILECQLFSKPQTLPLTNIISLISVLEWRILRDRRHVFLLVSFPESILILSKNRLWLILLKRGNIRVRNLSPGKTASVVLASQTWMYARYVFTMIGTSILTTLILPGSSHCGSEVNKSN